MYVTFPSTHHNTLSCRTPNAANRVASAWEHTWCLTGIIGWTSPLVGTAPTYTVPCRVSSCHVPSCGTNPRCTAVLHRPKAAPAPLDGTRAVPTPQLCGIMSCGAWSAMRLPALARVSHPGLDPRTDAMPLKRRGSLRRRALAPCRRYEVEGLRRRDISRAQPCVHVTSSCRQ